jgi:hypothetical protein
MASRTWDKALPIKYAESKQRYLDKRWDGELGEALRDMVQKVWPGVPETVFLGFTAFSTSASENTTEAVENQRFHEIGYFQTEAGLRDKPAPDPNSDGEYNNWGRLHDTDLVVQLLGRKACMGHDEWKRAIKDQTAVGLVNLRRKLDSHVQRLPENLRPKDMSSTWAVLLSFTVFSRGGGQTLRCLSPYAEKLGTFPENERWDAWESMIASSIIKGADSTGNKDGKSGAPWAIMRTRQKYDSGLLFAQRKGLPTDWYFEPVRERDIIIVKKAYNV